MTREEYIFNQAKELKKLSTKQKKLSERSMSGNLTQKATQNLHADMNWVGMEKSKTEERLGFVMGFLRLSDLREFYEPSAYHKYNGIRAEMEKLKFD